MADEKNYKSSKDLVKDLSTIPEIIGALGLSISAAQKAMNLDYLENIRGLISMRKKFKGTDQAEIKEFESILLSLAPSRYQFTETNLSVRLDLAQTFSQNEQVGLGVNVGTVAVTAAMSSAYGYDYQAAAEVKTVLHAIPADASVFQTLLSRAKSIEGLDKPDRSHVDDLLIESTSKIFKELGGSEDNDTTNALEE